MRIPALGSHAVLVVSVLAACGGTPPKRPDLTVALGDLAAIRERGVLRVLIPTLTEPHLPRAGSPDAEDRNLIESLARRLGLSAEFITIENRGDLLELLERGYGDLVAAQLTVTPARENRVRFTEPTAVVDEWLVGRRGAQGLPRSPDELDGREVHVRASSAFAETLGEVEARRGIDVVLVPVDERLDTETIAYEVSRGERPLTVVDDNLLAAVETYNEDLERLFVLARDRRLAWAIRRDAPELGEVVDTFIVEHYLTEHRSEDFSTDGLSGVLDRGSLRVLTLNNPINYFLYRGRMMGFDYEVSKLAAERLGVRLEMVVPPSRELIFDWLLEGRGDVIGSTLTVTPGRQEFLAFSRPYLFIREVVVQSAAAGEPVTEVTGLEGKRIHAWRSSSHYQSLLDLLPVAGPYEIVPIPEDMEFEDILDRVASGEFPLAVVDSHVLEAELAYRNDVVGRFDLEDPRKTPPDHHTVAAHDKAVAFAVRPNNRELLDFFDGFVSDMEGSLRYNVIQKRYFEENRGLSRFKQRRAAVSGRLSPYDEIFKLYSKRYGLDWRLMVAQAYQESRFDPAALSWAGAEGVFQILPATASELGFEELESPEAGIHAGIKYMSQLMERFEPSIEIKHRVRFALAAYNAGFGHVDDARRLAAERGWDPDKWFGHTERAMLLLSRPEHYRRARYGYVRGSEPVEYVSRIQNLYDHYVSLVAP